MPDASYYARQGKLFLSISSQTDDPVLLKRLREKAKDYLAKALKLKMDRAANLPNDLQAHP